MKCFCGNDIPHAEALLEWCDDCLAAYLAADPKPPLGVFMASRIEGA